MKKLQIHIGYPKTATSTIQNHLLSALGEMGELNYLGRTNRSGKKYQFGENLVFDLVFGEGVVSIDKQYFSEDTINVLSNEDIVTSFKNIVGSNVLQESDPTKVAERIYSLFNPLGYEIEILVTIRAQVDLIHSFYVEGCKWHFRHEKSLNTFDKYLEQGLANKEKGVFLMFYYYKVIKSYADIFGKERIKIMFYEDIKHDFNFYTKELSELLGIDAKFVRSVFREKQDNVKIKNSEGSFTNALTLDQLFVDMFRYMLPKEKFFKLKKNRYISFITMKFTKFLRRFTFGSSRLVPNLVKEQRKIVLEEFSESNNKLARDFALDVKKMKAYGYM